MNYQDNPFQKNVELWQQFSQSYLENMFGTFEKNLEQSKVFQEQMQTAVSLVVNSQFEMVMAGLKALESQMADLSKILNEMAKAQ